MKKILVIVAVMMLSVSAFALVKTTVYFSSMPTKPSDRPQNVTVKCTYYMPNEVRNAETTASFMDTGGTIDVIFPGSDGEAATVTYTKVDLFFYNSYTGTGGNFSGIPAILSTPGSFGDWWTVTSLKDKDGK